MADAASSELLPLSTEIRNECVTIFHTRYVQDSNTDKGTSLLDISRGFPQSFLGNAGILQYLTRDHDRPLPHPLLTYLRS
jgi:hypothetical protein